MASLDNTAIRDPVYGYIEIPKIIIKNIVDTEIFQRLKHIQQTSMQPLFPAAVHNRFIHSLGVYHIGKIAFSNFHDNTINTISEINEKCLGNDDKIILPDEEWWIKQQFLFEMACMLHDCAHAPFSHTFEFVFDTEKVKTNYVFKDSNLKFTRTVAEAGSFSKLSDELLKTYLSKEFEYDFFGLTPIKEFPDYYNTNEDEGTGSEHERLSAIIAKRYFESGLQKSFALLNKDTDVLLDDSDFEQIARMIIGCRYTIKRAVSKNEKTLLSLKNCLISLLNSEMGLDLDVIDYVIRDAYFSGLSNITIDYQRLLKSITVQPVIVFDNYEANETIIDGIFLGNRRKNFEGSRICLETIDCNKWLDGEIAGEDFTLTLDDNYDPVDSEFIELTLRNSFKIVHYGSIMPADNKQAKMKTIKSYSIIKIDDENVSFHIDAYESCRIKGSLSGMINGRIAGNSLNFNESDRTWIEFDLAFEKAAISVLQNLVEARNYEFSWIHTHPTSVYATNLQCEMLTKVARFLCCKKHKRELNEELAADDLEFNCGACSYKYSGADDILAACILGIESFYNTDHVDDLFKELGYTFYLTNDDDLNGLFKKVYLEACELGEIPDSFSRCFRNYFSHRFEKPLWKSLGEYQFYFNTKDSQKRNRVNKLINTLVKPISGTKINIGGIRYPDDARKIMLANMSIFEPICIKTSGNVKPLRKSSVLISGVGNERCMMLSDLIASDYKNDIDNEKFFYLYGDISIGGLNVRNIVDTLCSDNFVVDFNN